MDRCRRQLQCVIEDTVLDLAKSRRNDSHYGVPEDRPPICLKQRPVAQGQHDLKRMV